MVGSSGFRGRLGASGRDGARFASSHRRRLILITALAVSIAMLPVGSVTAATDDPTFGGSIRLVELDDAQVVEPTAVAWLQDSGELAISHETARGRREVVRVAPGGVPSGPSVALDRIDPDTRAALGAPGGSGTSSPTIIDPVTGNTLSASGGEVRETDAAGQSIGIVSVGDDVEIVSMAIGSSADSTDPESTRSLYVVGRNDAGGSSVYEIRSTEAVSAAAAAVDSTTLVGTTLTSGWSPPSPDPSGLAFVTSTGRLIISDGEVNEMTIFAGANVFEAALTGNLIDTYNTLPALNEPTGIAHDPVTGHYFITDDTGDRGVFEFDPGPDGILATNDDTVSFSPVAGYGVDDPEGVAFDPVGRVLYVADGLSEEVFRITPGPNGIFEGSAGDDVMTQFDTTSIGIQDPEGVEWNPDAGTLLILGGNDLIAETTTSGALVRHLDISQLGALNPAGIAYGPGSQDPSARHVYVVDRAVDNNQDPNENDGVLFELAFGATGTPNLAPTVDAGPDVQTAVDEVTSLSGTVTDDGEPDPPATVTVAWSVLDGPGAATFADPSSAATTATFDTPGVYTLRLTADDSAAVGSDTTTVTVADPTGAISIERRVAAQSDDAEQSPGGAMSLNSSDLELVFDGGANQLVGMRFLDIAVPRGAEIVDAWVQFTVDETASGATTVTIRGQAADDAPTFSSAVGNISARPTTSASASWSPAPWTTIGQAGPAQRTPTLRSVVQQIVDRPGWNSGNSLALIVSGTGERVAESFNGSAVDAPLLHVTYRTGPPPPNTPPTVSAGADSTVSAADAASLDGTVTDDGLPNPPGVVTTTWSVTSGPGTVTFADSNAVDTTATFSQAGSYVLRLTADDSEDSVFDEVTVTVTVPVNQAPTVSAGPDRTISVAGVASLDGTVTDDGFPNPPGNVTTTWSVVSGPGTVAFGDPDAVDTTAGFSATGSYVLRLTADDSEFSVTDDTTITVTPDTGGTTIEARVATGADDSEERSNGAVDLTSSDLELVHDRGGSQTVGLRFPAIGLPAGAVIVDAWVQFTVDETVTDPTQLAIRAQDSGSAQPFANTSFDLSTRPTTVASTSWTPALWTTIGDSGPDQRTPNIANVIQEVVNRPGWTNTSPLVLLITGTGERVAESYDGSAPDAPLLHVEYVVTSQQRPHVDAGPDQTIAVEDTLTLNAEVTDDGLPDPPGAVTTSWTTVSGPGTVTFADPTAVDTTATVSEPGDYLLRLTASDGQLSASDEVAVTVAGPGGVITLDVRVGNGFDDAEEQSTGAVGTGSSDLELVQEDTLQTVGMRFNGIDIPRGATITDAWVQFTVDETTTVATSLVVRGQAADAAPSFTAAAGNISGRPVTTASAGWAPPPWTTVGAAGPDQRAVGLSGIVQEIVDRPGWVAGNSLVLIITGTGERVAESHNGSPGDAPLLHVEYELDLP